jgi:hypothetical protein
VPRAEVSATTKETYYSKCTSTGTTVLVLVLVQYWLWLASSDCDCDRDSVTVTRSHHSHNVSRVTSQLEFTLIMAGFCCYAPLVQLLYWAVLGCPFITG